MGSMGTIPRDQLGHVLLRETVKDKSKMGYDVVCVKAHDQN